MFFCFDLRFVKTMKFGNIKIISFWHGPLCLYSILFGPWNSCLLMINIASFLRGEKRFYTSPVCVILGDMHRQPEPDYCLAPKAKSLGVTQFPSWQSSQWDHSCSRQICQDFKGMSCFTELYMSTGMWNQQSVYLSLQTLFVANGFDDNIWRFAWISQCMKYEWRWIWQWSIVQSWQVTNGHNLQSSNFRAIQLQYLVFIYCLYSQFHWALWSNLKLMNCWIFLVLWKWVMLGHELTNISVFHFPQWIIFSLLYFEMFIRKKPLHISSMFHICKK